MYVSRRKDRDILKFINRSCEHKNVLLVEGARQVGKSALSVNLKHARGLCEYMRLYGQDVGVIVSLAPQCVLDLSGGGKIHNVPVYLVERLVSENWKLGAGSDRYK